MTPKAIVSIIILIVIVLGAAIPLVNSYKLVDENQYKTDSWHYDDYRSGNGVMSTAGAIELIEVGGVPYLHAKDLGNATITYANGKVETVGVSKANLDVVVALGQSNNCYSNLDQSTATCPPIGTSYYYGMASYPLFGNLSDMDGTIQPMVRTPGTPVIGDKAPPFCAAYYEHTYHKIYYINGSWPGTSILTWQPGEESYEAAKTVIEKAMDSIDETKFNVSVMGYTWIQGEQDKTMKYQTYYDYFLTMHDSILAGGLGIELNHCFISKVKDDYPGPSNAQVLLNRNVDTVTLVTSVADTFTPENGLIGSDNVHYTQTGDNIIGDQLGEAMADYYYPFDETPANRILVVIPIMMVVVILIIAAKMVIGRND